MSISQVFTALAGLAKEVEVMAPAAGIGSGGLVAVGIYAYEWWKKRRNGRPGNNGKPDNKICSQHALLTETNTEIVDKLGNTTAVLDRLEAGFAEHRRERREDVSKIFNKIDGVKDAVHQNSARISVLEDRTGRRYRDNDSDGG